MDEERKKQVKEEKVEKLSRFFMDYVDEVPTMEGKIAVLFYGYFKNKMQIIAHTIAFAHIKREPVQLERTIQSLNDIFHHFGPQDGYHVSLFEELLEILKKVPHITEQEIRHGLDIIEELFKIFDMEVNLDKENLLELGRKGREKKQKEDAESKKKSLD